MPFARRLVGYAIVPLLLLASTALGAPIASLRWNTCDDGSTGLATDQTFGGPGMYTQVVSGRGFDFAPRGVSLEVEVRAPGGLPDAWRFDPGGCQDGAFQAALGALSKSCVSIGTGTVVLQSYSYDSSRGTARIRFSATLNGTGTLNPSATYVLGRLSFDHSASVTGASAPGQCGGADAPVCFQLLSVIVLDPSGAEVNVPLSNRLLTWQNPTGASPCFVSPYSGVRIDELFLKCPLADTTVQFLELNSSTADDHFDAHLHVRLRGADGSVVLDRGDLFGTALEGQPWPVGENWLIGTQGFATVENVPTDAQIPAALDPTGGKVELYDDRDPGALLQSMEYGPGTANPVPPAGSSLTRISESGYAATPPTPVNAAGNAPPVFLCPAGDENIVVRSLALGCTSGSNDGQFLELYAPIDQRFESTMRVAVHGSDGTTSLDLSGLFSGEPDGTVWPAGRSWLLAPLNFVNRTGVPPDRIMPRSLDASGGTVDLYGGPGGTTLLQHIAYGPGAPDSAPPMGYGLTHQSDGSFAIDPAPAPRNFAGASGAGSACFCPGPLCADSTLAGVRIDRVALACANGEPGTQFIVLRATSPHQAFQSGLRLTVRTHDGLLPFDASNMFTGRPNGSAWPTGAAWLLGGTLLAQTSGVVPDGPTFNELGAVGATFTLFDSRIGGGVLQTLDFGPGSLLPLPGPGQSLVGGANGTWSLAGQQEPENFAGAHALIAQCPCPITAVFIGSGGWVYYTAAAKDTANTNTRAHYDLTTGTFDASTSGNGESHIDAADLYTLTGGPAGQSLDLVASLFVTGGGGGYCTSNGDCDAAGGGAALRANSTSNARNLGKSENSALTLPLHVAYGTAFRLETILGAVAQGPFGTAVAGYHATLGFTGLPPGTSITSCNGYRLDQPVATLPAILVAQPSTEAVHLEWSTSSDATGAALVERTSDDAEWITLGDATRTTDRFVFDDRAVIAGAHLGYRLRWMRGTEAQYSDVTWVDVPAAHLALRALSANPSLGPVTLAYDLPAAGAARLELLDLRGRRAWSRELGVQAAGSHVASLAGERLAAGVYWARVTLGGRQATLRLVVLGSAR